MVVLPNATATQLPDDNAPPSVNAVGAPLVPELYALAVLADGLPAPPPAVATKRAIPWLSAPNANPVQLPVVGIVTGAHARLCAFQLASAWFVSVFTAR